jgi:hypothetical protein
VSGSCGSVTTCACGEGIDPRRVSLGYTTCLSCGEREAKQVKHTVAIPYSKGAYQLITNPDLLRQTNPKRAV